MGIGFAENWWAAENCACTGLAHFYVRKTTIRVRNTDFDRITKYREETGYSDRSVGGKIKELETVVKANENIPVEILRNGQLSETNGTSVMSKTTHSRRGTFKFRFFRI